MATRRTQKSAQHAVPSVVTAPSGLRPAGEQSLDAASWERLRRVITALAALSKGEAAERPSERAPRRR